MRQIIKILKNTIMIFLIIFLLTSVIKIESYPLLNQTSQSSGIDAYIISNSISVTPIDNSGNGATNVQIQFTIYSSDIYLAVIEFSITRSDNNNLVSSGSSSNLLNEGNTPITIVTPSEVFYNSFYSGKMKLVLSGILQANQISYNIASESYEFNSAYTDYAVPDIAVVPNSFNIQNIKDTTLSNGSGYDYVIASIQLNSSGYFPVQLTTQVYDPSFGIVTDVNSTVINKGVTIINFYYSGSLFYNLYQSGLINFNITGIHLSWFNAPFMPILTFSHFFTNSDYNPPPIILNESNNTIQFVDKNNDSLFDYIQIKMSANFKINASLEITSGAFIQSVPTFGLAYTYINFDGLGNQEILLNYSGGAIYNSYYNGNLTFFFDINVQYKNFELKYNIFFFQNQSIEYSKFNRPDVSLTPNSLDIKYLQILPNFNGKYDRIYFSFNVNTRNTTSNIDIYYGFRFNQNYMVYYRALLSLNKGNSTQTLVIDYQNLPKSNYSGPATFFVTGYIHENNTSDSIAIITKQISITFNDFVNVTINPFTSSDTNSISKTGGFLPFPQIYFDLALIAIILTKRHKIMKNKEE